MKKLITLLLLLSLTVSGTYAFNDVGAEFDVNAIDALNALGIMQGYGDGSFHPEENMTRAEFAVAVTNILGIDFEGVEKTEFSDVPDNHFAAGAISYLTAGGAISGYSDGRFGTDDAVTAEQAIKILTELAGYGIVAEAKGGYPSGYLSVATENEILNGISNISFKEPAKRGIIAKLIYNTLKIRMYVQTSFSEAGVAFEKKGTLLEEYRDIKILEGQITENEYSSLTGIGNMPEGAVKLAAKDGEITVYEGKAKLSDKLGYKVEVFAYENEEEYEAMYVSVLPMKKTVIYGGEILSVKNGIITYEKRENPGKEYEARLDFDYDLIYNGVAKYDFEPSELVIENGYLELLDTDKSGGADVVFLNRSETVIFDKYNKAAGIIKDKFRASKNIYTEEDGKFIALEIFRDGEKISPDSLKEWTVLSVYRSANEEGTRLIRIIATEKSLLLKATAREEDKVVFGPDSYFMSSDFKKNEEIYGTINPGELRRFLFNERDEIACVAKAEDVDGFYYGYISGVKADTYGNSAIIKLFLEDGTLNTYSLSEKVKIDGETVFSTEVKKLLLYAKYDGAPSDEDVSQFVKIGFSKDGEVNSIDTAKENSVSSAEELEVSFENESVSYSIYSLGAFGGKLIFGADTMIFNVPGDASDDEGYRIVDYSVLGDGTYICSGYDISESGDSGIILIKGDIVTAIDNDSPLYVVERKTTGVRADGSVGEKYFFSGTNGSSVEGYFDENTEYFAYRSSMGIKLEKKDIEPGDIIRMVRVPTDGRITVIERMFDVGSLGNEDYCGEITFSGAADPLFSQSLRLVTAKAKYAGMNTALMSIYKPADMETKEVFWNFAGAQMLYIKQMGDGSFRIERGNINNINDIDTVGEGKASVLVAKTRYGALNDVFIYDFNGGGN